jgi:hypothetical protein
MTFDVLTIVVFLNVLVTIELWRRAARRPEKPKKKFLNQLWRSKPIMPKHQPPPPLEKGYAVGDGTLQFFSDFEDFANVINSWLTDTHIHPHNSPWRLQELPEAGLSLLAGPGPSYGRIDWVRLLPFEIVRSFLVDIAKHVSEYRSGTVDYVQANEEIDRAMTSVVWNALNTSQYSLENEPSYDALIQVELTGSASFYLDRRQYVRNEAAKAGQQKA